MKTLMIACSVVALAGAAGIATAQRAEAGFFDKQKVRGCHRVETNLPQVPYIWKCNVDSLPSWWQRNESLHIPGGDDNTPVGNSPSPPKEHHCSRDDV
jgi:hypothetical protein